MNKIYNSDCVEFMKGLVDSSVDLVIADPPYEVSQEFEDRAKYKGQLRDRHYEWDYEFDQTAWLKEAARILKTGGSMLIFNSYRNFGITQEVLKDLEFKRMLVWQRTNPSPMNRERLYVNTVDPIMWFVKGRGWPFNRQRDNYENGIFQYPSVSGKERIHQNQKPIGLIRDLVKIHSNAGDLVFDPFSGSGSVAAACVELDRNFIATEINGEIYKQSVQRLGNTNLSFGVL